MGIPKVLLDTGIGDHVDEAFALALAARSPEINLIGVTTTSYDAPTRAVLARRLLGAYGRSDVPVAAGSSARFRADDPGAARFSFTQLDYARHVEPMAPASPLPAVEFLARMIEAHAPVTIVATAPLTNIAELIQRHPRLCRGIERIIFMGGWSSIGLPEFNMYGDAEAVDVVLRSGIPATAVGYEVTLSCAMRPAHLRWLESAGGDGPSLLRQLYHAFYAGTEEKYPILHDPLTVAALVDPSLVTVRRLELRVITERGPGYGVLLHEPRVGHPVDVCVRVDVDGYLDLLLRRVAPDLGDPGVEERGFARWHFELVAAHRAQHYPGWRTRTIGNDHTLILVAEGKGELGFEGARHELSSGSVAYVPPDAEYTVRTEQGVELFWLQFAALHRDMPGKSGLGLFAPPPVRHLEGSKAVLISQAQRIVDHWVHPGAESALIAQAALYELLATLFAHLGEEHTAELHDSTSRALYEARRYIEARFAQEITLDALGQRVGMSKYHLLRAFKQKYGVTPLQYQTRLRMHHAKRLLRLHYMTLAEVASRVGYDSVSAFCRAFRREVGVSPGEYRA